MIFLKKVLNLKKNMNFKGKFRKFALKQREKIFLNLKRREKNNKIAQDLKFLDVES